MNANRLLLLLCVSLFSASSRASAGNYVLYYDVSVVAATSLDADARNDLRAACLSTPFTSSGLLKTGREVLGAESLYSPRLRVALFGISERSFAESRPLHQSLQTPTGPVSVGTLDVVVVPIPGGTLGVQSALTVSSALSGDYPSITQEQSFTLPADGGRSVSLAPVPGRTDVVYLTRLAVVPTE